MAESESPGQADQGHQDRAGTDDTDLPAIDEGSPEEQRLDALAPVDTEQLEASQRAIDEAKQAAEPVRRYQRDDIDDGPEPAVTPDADIDDSVDDGEREAAAHADGEAPGDSAG